MSFYHLLHKESKKSIDIVLVSGTRNENTIMLEEKYQSIAKKAGIKLHCFYSIDNADLRYLYANACLFIFPSISEGFGLPVLEAINLGSLALCSNTSATPEIVDNNKLYTFDPLDPKDLCERIHYFLKLENNELLNHKKNQKDFCKKFTFKNSVNKVTHAFKDLANLSKEALADDFFEPAQLAKQFEPKSHTHLSLLSDSLMKNFPIRKKYILIDVSILSVNDAKSGIQRVVRNLCAEFINREYEDYEIKFVSSTGTNFIINYDFEKKLTHL